MIRFNKTPSGKGLFNEPYWNSCCGKFRLVHMDCVRPYRLFRRLGKRYKGYNWIGVGSGFVTRSEAIFAAFQYSKGLL
jgi:hypothetical protein